MKTKPATKPVGDDAELKAWLESYPTPIELAQLAAQPRFSSLDARQAAKDAFQLWLIACTTLGDRKEKAVEAAFETDETIEQFQRLTAGVTFPASFETFLSRIVPGKTPSERRKRFHDFVRRGLRRSADSVAEPTVAAVSKLVEQYSKMSFGTSDWMELALNFESFWSEHLKAEKIEAGKASAKKKAKALKASSGKPSSG